MEWLMFVSGDDFRNALDQGLALLVAKSTPFWLADLRHLGVVTDADQTWSNEVWFPRALQTTLTHMAIVMPEKVIARWSVDRIMQRVEGTQLVIHYFDNVDAAYRWFANQRVPTAEEQPAL